MSETRDQQTAAGADTVVGDATTAASAAPAGLAIGDRIAERYTIRRFLGRGGMGAVYEAADEQLHHHVAVKVLLSGRFDDARATAMLRREIAAARRVTHPNVCRVYDVKYHRLADSHELGLYTMELLDGESLTDRIRRRGALTVAEALPIVEQLCAGLAAAHDAGIVHRDFKPHNVMLCGGRAVITDFGLAHALEAGDPTQSMELMGTPAYMAPEQLTGGKTTVAVDVYALGVTMFEMMTGELPFSASTPLATALARVHADAPSPRARVAELDPRWDGVIRRCLARDPDARPRLADVVPALTGAPPRAPRRRRAPLVFAGLGLAVMAAAVTIVLSGHRTARAPAPVAESFTDGALARLVRLGGPGREKIQGATRDAAGNLYFVGHASGGASLGTHALAPAESTANLGVVGAVAPDGTLRWSRTFAGTSIGLTTVAESDGTLFLSGHAGRGTFDLGEDPLTVDATYEAFLIALSASDGHTLWSTRMAAQGESYIRASGVGPDGNLYVAGEFAGAMTFAGSDTVTTGSVPYVASYRTDGTPRWIVHGKRGKNTRTFALTFLDGAVVVGGGASEDVEFAGARWKATEIRAPFLAAIELDTGRPRWSRGFPATGGEVWSAIATRDGRLLIGGHYSEQLDAGPGLRLETPATITHGFIAEIALRDGATTWIREVGSSPTGSWVVGTLTELPDRTVVVTGWFEPDLTLGGVRHVAPGGGGHYVAKLDARGEVSDSAVLGGAADKQLKGATALGDGELAVWGRHTGLVVGDVEIPGAGDHDGYYAELRLDALFDRVP